MEVNCSKLTTARHFLFTNGVYLKMNILKHWQIIPAIFFACTISVRADPLDNLSPYDGVAALQAGDAAGLEVIPRSELEEVRGGPLNPELYNAALKESSFEAFRQTEIAKKFPDEVVVTIWRQFHENDMK